MTPMAGAPCFWLYKSPHERLFSKLFGVLLLLLWTFCAVLGTALHSVGYTLCIECTADDVVTNTREVLNTAATDQNNRVLLKVVADTRNISGSTIGKTARSLVSLVSWVLIAVHTPRFCGEFWLINASLFREFHPFRRAGAVDFFSTDSLPLRTNWLKVGILHLLTKIKNFVFPAGHSLSAGPAN